MIERVVFKLLIRTLKPVYTIPSRKHMMTVLKGMKEKVMRKVKHELIAVVYVSLTAGF